MSTYNSLQR